MKKKRSAWERLRMDSKKMIGKTIGETGGQVILGDTVTLCGHICEQPKKLEK